MRTRSGGVIGSCERETPTGTGDNHGRRKTTLTESECLSYKDTCKGGCVVTDGTMEEIVPHTPDSVRHRSSNAINGGSRGLQKAGGVSGERSRGCDRIDTSCIYVSMALGSTMSSISAFTSGRLRSSSLQSIVSGAVFMPRPRLYPRDAKMEKIEPQKEDGSGGDWDRTRSQRYFTHRTSSSSSSSSDRFLLDTPRGA